MEPTSDQINQLRNNFLEKLESSNPDQIHPNDLDRIKDNDDWLRRFLLHTEIDFNESLELLWEACLWRKSFGTNEINENNVRKDILEEGLIFPHNKDKDGRTLLILKCKNYVKRKNDIDVKRCIVYWFERLERSENGQPITLFFDLTDTGISSLDLELIKYLISLFKLYYPYFLNYILIFEMPWILNTALKLIKTWLPAKAVEKLKVLNKNTIKDYVTSEQCLTAWGGTDDYFFEFTPDDNKKKVHFAQGSPSEEFSQSLEDSNEELISLLHIYPEDAIKFSKIDNDLSGEINLINMSHKYILFKMKTTAPVKFLVRPAVGCISPKASITIKVSVSQDYDSLISPKDRFLIMYYANDIYKHYFDINPFLKNVPKSLIKQTTLKCVNNSNNDANQGILKNGSVLESIDEISVKKLLNLLIKEVEELKKENLKLHSYVNFNKKINILILLLILISGGLLAYFILYELMEFKEKSCLLTH